MKEVKIQIKTMRLFLSLIMTKKTDHRLTKSSTDKLLQVKELDPLPTMEIPDINQLPINNNNKTTLFSSLKECSQVNSTTSMMLMQPSRTTTWTNSKCKNSICSNNNSSIQECSSIREGFCLEVEEILQVVLKWWATQSSALVAWLNQEVKLLTKLKGKSLEGKWYSEPNRHTSLLPWTNLPKFKKKTSKISSETLKLQIILPKTKTLSWRLSYNRSNMSWMQGIRNLRS